MLNKLTEIFKKKDSIVTASYEARRVGYKIRFKDSSVHTCEYTCDSSEKTDESLEKVKKALAELAQILKETLNENDFINCLGLVFKKSDFEKAYLFNFSKSEKCLD